MTDQLRHKNSAGGDEASLPAEFIAVCVLAFVAGVSATAYFCRSMCCEMEMPGGWTMSIMWMRMPGHKDRDLADEVVEADLNRPDTLQPAFAGARGVFLVTSSWLEGTDEFTQGYTSSKTELLRIKNRERILR